MMRIARRLARLGFLSLAATLPIAGFVDAQEPYYYAAAATAQQAPPDAPTALPQEGAPSWEDYQKLVERLESTERQLQAISDETQELERLPLIVEERRIHADGNPDVPTSGQRLTAIEKLLGKKDDSGPKYPTFKLTGFMHLDAGAFDQSANSIATLGDIQNGVGFRRARLQAVGSVSEFTNYSLEMDFATAGRPSFLDVWGEQTHVPFFGNVRVGHFRQPFSVDALTPVRQLDFLERSLPFQAFVPFRRVGVMAYDKTDDELTSFAYGVYRTGGFANQPLGDSRFATDIGDNGGASFSGRATHLLYYDEPTSGRYLFHVGGAYNYSRITGGTPTGNSYEARVIPEFFVGDPAGGGLTATGTPFVADTGRLAATDFNLYGLEMVGQYGSAHFQAEYMFDQVNQIAAPNVQYDGGYIQGGYFLTGENRTYNKMFGTFDRVTPYTNFFGLGRHDYVCGWGAWEVLGRVSYVNLNDPNAVPTVFAVGPPPSPNPGRVTDLTLGLNWYLNSYTKFQFNYINVMLDNAALGDSYTNIYAGRFQIEF